MSIPVVVEAIVTDSDTHVNKKDTKEINYFNPLMVDASKQNGYCHLMNAQLFQELLDGAGTNQAGLAQRVGVSRQLINKWKTVEVPATHVIKLEKVTGVPREKIRPDVFDEEFILQG